ncbi:hypothetical protein [Salinimicrobium sp. GXAS 041]|uniref:hypothetical protein n=1 Tax=Salinimicrobium sp. GXAS 041 TaxID=3400806 RepID=UPI003C7524D9
MKFLMLIFLFSLHSGSADPDLDEIRALYKQAPGNEQACEKMISILEPFEKEPLWLGYKGVATMIMAKHVFSPFKKMSLFKEGKGILNDAIEMDRDNVELRFLRYSAQTQAPSFLSYKDDVEEDQQFLINRLSNMEDLSLKNAVLDFLMENDALSTREKEMIKN